MSSSIINIHPYSPFKNLHDTLAFFQSEFPMHWCYKPVGIEIEITNKCNLSCHGCGQRDEKIRPEDILSTEEYICAIRQARQAGIRACSLTGGETFLFLERVRKIFSCTSGIDFFKVNTNGYRFVSDEATQSILKDLRDAGFGRTNKYILPVFVTSVGQQNKAGMPIERALTLVKNFYKIFTPSEALCTINVTDENAQDAHQWTQTFRKRYREETGHALDPDTVPIRSFLLNNIPTLERLGLVSKKKVPIRELLESYKSQYVSWKCLNLLPEDVSDLTTLTPKCVLRPNGDLIACPGYNYVHKIGNVREKSVGQILADANKNPILRTVFTKGLLGLLDEVQKKNPAIEQQKLSISYAPCDVCAFLREEVLSST